MNEISDIGNMRSLKDTFNTYTPLGGIEIIGSRFTKSLSHKILVRVKNNKITTGYPTQDSVAKYPVNLLPEEYLNLCDTNYPTPKPNNPISSENTVYRNYLMAILYTPITLNKSNLNIFDNNLN